MKYRPYESAIIAKAPGLLKKHGRIVLVGPTGSGKTVIGSAIAAQAPSRTRVLVVGHRQEMVEHWLRALGQAGIPRTDLGILSGRRKDGWERRVLCASIGMFDSRLVPEFGLLIVDEAHHAMAKRYTDLIFARPNAPVLGLTATAARPSDGQPLGNVFNHLEVFAEALELQQEGFLAPFEVYGIPEEQARELVGDLRSSGADYSKDRLRSAIAKRPLMGDIVSTWKRLGKNQRTLVYACNREHGKLLLKRFRAAGVAAGYVDAETDPVQRYDLLGPNGKLASGEIRVVVNVEIVTEGFDCPAVGCIVLARPTKSIVLMLQMCGRGARPEPGKEACTLLDHAGNVWRHGFPDDPIEWSLDGIPRRKGGEAPLRHCPECEHLIPIGCAECTYCGAERPVSEKELAEQTAELRRLEAERIKRESFFRGLAAKRGLGEEWIQRAMRAAS